MSLLDPSIDWVKLAEGMGVSAVRTETCARFEEAFVQAMRGRGPLLIEAVIP
jgi:acetolactate synthase-1/2/3 large subunit